MSKFNLFQEKNKVKNVKMDNEKLKYSQLLTAPEINQCRKELRGILIAPFNSNKAKGIGYNLSPSDLFYSTKKVCHYHCIITVKEVMFT